MACGAWMVRSPPTSGSFASRAAASSLGSTVRVLGGITEASQVRGASPEEASQFQAQERQAAQRVRPSRIRNADGK